jgi:hypothetical protein
MGSDGRVRKNLKFLEPPMSNTIQRHPDHPHVHEEHHPEHAAPKPQVHPPHAEEKHTTHAGHVARNTFERSSFQAGDAGHPGHHGSLDHLGHHGPVDLGDGTATTLRTERLGDGSANCLERAAALAHRGDEVVLLQDSKDAVGHAVVRHGDGSVTDPNTPTVRYESLGQFQATHPQYHGPVRIPDTQLEQVLGTPPGAGRDALLSQLGLSGVANRAVADGPVTRGLQVTFEPPAKEGKGRRMEGSVTQGPYSGVGLEVSWDPSRPNPDGRYQVAVEVKHEVGTMSQGGARVGPFGVEGGTASGLAGSRSYTLNLTQAELNRLQTGQLPLPTITDPRAMPAGTQVTMSAEVFGSANLGASFRGLNISDEVRAGVGYSFGVEKLEGEKVRISVGPTETLERTQRLGIGVELGSVEVSAELSRSTKRTGAALASVELDLSTAQGRIAYDQFLRTRNLPSDGPGVSNRTTSQVMTVQEAAAAGLTVGPLSASSHLWSETTSMVVTTQGGKKTATVNTTAAGSGNNITSTYRFENGKPVFDSLSFEMTLPEGRRATVQVEGMRGVESLQRVAFKAAQANLFADLKEEGTPAQLKQRFAKEPKYAALAKEPGEPGFSGQAWLDAYHRLEVDSGGLPTIPAVAEVAIRAGQNVGASADWGEALRRDLVGNLRTPDSNMGVFEGVADDMSSPDATHTWLDSGLRTAPGVTVTLPPNYP